MDRSYSKRTKIVCTLGPATASLPVMKAMLEVGLDVARVNFSHGSPEANKKLITLIRRAANMVGKPIAIMQDLQGPRLRIGKLATEPVLLEEGQRVTLGTGITAGSYDKIPVTFKLLVKAVEPGSLIFLNDGLVGLQVERIVNGKSLLCRVKKSGAIYSHKGVNIPDIRIPLPALTTKDKKDLAFGIEQKVDFVALSFVSDGEDIERVRRVLRKRNYLVPIIAKIERRDALKNIENIIKAADGIMIARGDLGIEVPLEKVPLVQKEIIARCAVSGKPVITATQMLESMVSRICPTRAEVSDIANAVFDGTDALMLSGETSIGKYPVEAVTTMVKVVREVEAELDYAELLRKRGQALSNCGAEGIAHATCQLAQDLNLSTIVTFTMSGSTACMISRYRPRACVIALTPREDTLRRMSLYWGVKAFLCPSVENTDEMFQVAEKLLRQKKLAKRKEMIVLTAGVPVKVEGITNLIRLYQVP